MAKRILGVLVLAGTVLLAPAAAGAGGVRAGAGVSAAIEATGGTGAGASISAAASATPAGGKAVIAWGADLTPEQKQAMAAALGAPSGALEVSVTNAEEHQVLGAYFDARTIGSRAISSVLVRPAPSGQGLRVTTQHITTVTPAMYENALATAGVRDADVFVVAPFDVSGTAALTGILKAYEVSTGTALAPQRREIAPAEVAQTIRLAQALGSPDLAAAFMTRLKAEMARHPSDSPESIRQLILSVASDLGVKLSDQMVDELVLLVQKMKKANIDWEGVQDQLARARSELHRFLGNDTPLLKAWVDRIYGWVVQFLALLRQWLA